MVGPRISCEFFDSLGQALERHSGPPAYWFPALSRQRAPPVSFPDCWVGLGGEGSCGSDKVSGYEDASTRCDKTCNRVENLIRIFLR